jgi:hypothetical protein
LLELLNRFFTEIDMTGVPSGIDNYCWYDGDVERAIEITVALELDEAELEEVFPIDALTLIRETKELKNSVKTVTVSRRIAKPPPYVFRI